MKILSLAAASFLFGSAGAIAAPLSTSFTYQGQIELSGQPLDASADVLFKLFDAASGGTQIGSQQQVNGITVERGLFNASIDFGAAGFNGDARWLELAVRSPAGGGVFTTLAPRQPLTATPYALQTRGLFVDSTNRVGIGTTTPSTSLSLGNAVANTKLLVWDDGPGTGLGFGVGPAQFRMHLSGPTNRFSFLNGPLGSEVFTVAGSGNVGVGTSGPTAKLDVRGDVKLGPGGQYFASAADENVRMIRGIVDGEGNILQGAGFTANRWNTGFYGITFNQAFANIPSGMANPINAGTSKHMLVSSSLPTRVNFSMQDMDGNAIDGTFHFCVIGPDDAKRPSYGSFLQDG